MKRIVTLLVLLSVCSFAFATEGRVNGMGVNPIFYNDDYLINIFPQYLTQYMNNAYIDAYYNSYCGNQYSGGLNFKLFGNDFGIYINRNFPVQFDYTYAKLEKAINMYLAMGGLGLGFDIAMDNYTNDNYSSGNSLKESTLGVGGKIGLEVSGFDIGGQVHYATGNSTEEHVEEYKDNVFLVEGAARMKMFETDKSVVYPAVTLEMASAKETCTYLTKTDEKDEETFSYFCVDPGIGLNHWLTKEVLVIAAASCGFYTGKYKSSYTYSDTTYSYESDYTKITLPKLELGLEAYLAKWLTVRAGINKSYYYYSSDCDDMCKNGDSKVSYYDSYFNYTFGVGLEFGKFVIDWEICDDLLWNAPYIVTGNESDFASSLSLKYCFK
ncbi:hypothetical protein D4R71_00920 [bacterium]|nr:MAG: hypothetical protein D4R71_00920 [bacterium]